MKYVLLGSISPSWFGKQAERYEKSNAKLKQLGIKQESILYTQRGSTTLLKLLMHQGRKRCWALPYGITKKDLALCSLFQRSVTKQYRR